MHYLEVLSTYYPDVMASCQSNTVDEYSSIVWLSGGPIPKAELDEKIVLHAREKKKEEINIYREDVFELGIWFQGHLFDSDAKAKDNINGIINAIQLGVNLPEDFYWRDRNNINVPADSTFMVNLGLSMMNYVNNIYNASWAKKAEVNQISDPQLVKNYDVFANWPTNDMDGSKPA